MDHYRGGSWDDDLMHGGRPAHHLRGESPETLHRHFEHAKTVYPHHAEMEHPHHYEHARTVYPDHEHHLREYSPHERARTVYPTEYLHQ